MRSEREKDRDRETFVVRNEQMWNMKTILHSLANIYTLKMVLCFSSIVIFVDTLSTTQNGKTPTRYDGKKEIFEWFKYV